MTQPLLARYARILLTMAACVCAERQLSAAVDATQKQFLEKHCYECHGEDVQKAGLRLDQAEFDLSNAKTFERWQEVYERVMAGEMPPAKHKDQPAAEKRTAFAGKLKQSLLAAEQDRRSRDGRVVLRRLNREEYQNTMRDLFGIDTELESLLPEDSVAQGFDNISEALSMSSVLLERYMDAADKALDAVLVKGPAPDRQHWHVTLMPKRLNPEGDFRLRGGVRILPDETFVFFNSQVYQPVTVEQFHAPVEGRYRIRISEYAYQSAGKPLTIEWYGGSFDKKSGNAELIGQFDLLPDKPTVIEFEEKLPARGTLKPMPYRLKMRGLKDTAGYQGPGVAVQWVDVEGPIVDSWPPTGYKRMLGDLDLEKGTLADAEKAMRNLAPSLFRRPVSDEDIALYLPMVQMALSARKPFAEALRDGLKAMLCSPDFLFFREPAGPLDDYALATRLSYFLWSSVPDDILFQLARQGKLSDKSILHQQVERMLVDAKAQRFVDNFTGQWLGLRNIDATTPDKKLHPDFDDALKNAMVQETRLFFSELLKGDLSVANFVDSDFVIINQRLAELYSIPGVQGWDFRKVTLPADAHRGGILGQAAIMKITANGTTTSPVIRGNWILKNLLGKPVKPPPPNVPALEPDTRGATTIREQIARHRSNAACAICHDRMDPLGFALENFDVIGEWRSNYRVPRFSSDNPQNELRMTGYKPGPPVESAGTLPDGKSFANVDELKKLLLANKDQVAQCVAGKLLTYATGAVITFADKEEIADMLRQTSGKDHGLRTLIHQLVLCPSFLNK